VLEGVESEIGEFGSIFMAKDAANATFMSRSP
jgi:hypothetical protein